MPSDFSLLDDFALTTKQRQRLIADYEKEQNIEGLFSEAESMTVLKHTCH